MKFMAGVVVAAALLVAGGAAMADKITIETVAVGNPGNTGEWSGESYGGSGPDRLCGAVDYAYNIGKYEVTASQYTAFLNAVGGVDTYALYHTGMADTSFGSGISRSGSGTVGSPYTYSVADDFVNRPVNYVSWGDAARFSNWLTNGQQGAGTTETGSYALNGAMTNAALLAVSRIAEASRVAGKDYYFIPSEDEWYKAAYYNPATSSYYDYPTRSNDVPGRDLADASGNNANYYGTPYPIDSPYNTTLVGEFQDSDSPYGTFDQGGNVWERNEAILYGSYRGLRGGSFSSDGVALLAAGRYDSYPTDEFYLVGFRVSEVPEPATLSLLALGGLALLRRRKGARAA